jgi:cytoskeletal protein RodZ
LVLLQKPRAPGGEDQADEIKGFCEELKSARTYREMTLEEIARITRINEDYLRALEEGHWNRIPTAFLKGYLRNYAEILEMNLPKVMESFEALNYQGGEYEEKRREELPTYADLNRRNQGKHIPTLLESLPVLRYLLLGGVLLAVVLAAWTVWLVVGLFLPEPVKEVEIVTREVPVPEPVLVEADTLHTARELLHLQMTFSDSCYIRLASRDSLVTEKIFLPGDSVTFVNDTLFALVIGDPAALRLYLNGNLQPVSGTPHRRVDLLISASGVQRSRLGN